MAFKIGHVQVAKEFAWLGAVLNRARHGHGLACGGADGLLGGDNIGM